MNSKFKVLLKFWFSLEAPVNAKTYLKHGAGLMAFKYAVDALTVWLVTGGFFTPLHYLVPAMGYRQTAFESGKAAEVMLLVLSIWTLPFLWIGLSMTIRRAIDAGWSPWTGLIFAVPLVNYVTMIWLCFVPSNRRVTSTQSPANQRRELAVKSALLGVAAGLAIALGMGGFATLILGDYGAALFIGTPLVMGACSGYIFNKGHRQSAWATVGVGSATILFVAGTFILFAIEGLLCLMMAAPPAIVMALFGALIGRAIANTTPRADAHLAAVILALPLYAAAEPVLHNNVEFEVVTISEINAPPEVVWPNVITLELEPASRWVFELGIAHPIRAQIEGTGVGAIRYCEFSTGAFVEPITVWDAPRRLAFDVSKQPPPMTEISPYKNLHPPHMDGYLRTKRGEFRLVQLPNGRTRLEGSTWYELDIFPRSYWTLWSDALIHNIHERVLAHIKRKSEKEALTAH